MRHRIVLSYEALADNVTSDMVIKRIMEVVARPHRPLTDDQKPQAEGATQASTSEADPAGMPWKTA
jgi:MoxR-like ATPase